MLGSASRRTSGVLLATIALTLVACERPIVPPIDPEPGRLAVSANVAATNIQAMVIKVTAPDIPVQNPLVFNMVINDGLATGSVAIPAGSSRRLELEAFDGNQIKTHRGEKTIDVKPGSNNPKLEVVLLPIAGDQPVTAQFGNYAVAVTLFASTVTVGGTVQASVVVTDNKGTVITEDESQVQWATTHPGFFSVSPTGVVKGLVLGSGDVVATFNGYAGLAKVTVQ
jgi:hypothetical protein